MQRWEIQTEAVHTATVMVIQATAMAIARMTTETAIRHILTAVQATATATDTQHTVMAVQAIVTVMVIQLTVMVAQVIAMETDILLIAEHPEHRVAAVVNKKIKRVVAVTTTRRSKIKWQTL